MDEHQLAPISLISRGGNPGRLPCDTKNNLRHEWPPVLSCLPGFVQKEGVNRCQGGVEPFEIDNHIPRKGRQLLTVLGTEIDLGFPIHRSQNRQSVGSADHGPCLINQASMVFKQWAGPIRACSSCPLTQFFLLHGGQDLDCFRQHLSFDREQAQVQTTGIAALTAGKMSRQARADGFAQAIYAPHEFPIITHAVGFVICHWSGLSRISSLPDIQSNVFHFIQGQTVLCGQFSRLLGITDQDHGLLIGV